MLQTMSSRAGLRAQETPMLEAALQRLEDIVEQETAALRGRRVIDLKDFNDRKNQALLELTRAMRHLQPGPSNEALLSQIGGLKTKLEANRVVLKMHLDAVREVSTTLSDAIRDADSDGTYTQAIRSGGMRS